MNNSTPVNNKVSDKRSNQNKTQHKKPKKLTPRIAATIILNQLLKQQGSLASLLPQYTEAFSPQEKSFIKECCYGSCRWFVQLDEILSRLLKQPLKKKESDIKAILLLGLYQLQFMRIAEHAAINESVNTAIYFKKPWAKKLINAVLRSYQRQSQNEEDVCLFLQAQASKPSAHPEWLEKKIKRAWSHQADSIFIANNQHPPLTLRVNSQKISRSDYLALLEEKNINAKSALFSDDGIYLESPSPVTELPLFDQGGVSVQDEAAQLAASLLQLEPGQNVLDACCAPGGKTCHIGEKEPLLESLSALDVDERRLHKVRENLARIDIKVNLICGDAAQPATWLSQLPNPSKKFDRILLDAPCSATGIIRRQPDIKLLRQPEQIKTLVELQLKLLKALWPLLDDGGILLYATCSILPEENSQLVERFLAAQSDAGHQTIDASWGVPQAFGRQLLPVDSQIAGASHDGFYYAKLVKR